MQRYVVNKENWFEDQVTIVGDDFHHIVNVMRMKIGDEVICNHPSGVSFRCSITEINDSQVLLAIHKKLSKQVELPVEVTLIHGLPKGDKLEWVAQKATELGVHKIIPLQCKRSIVKWDDQKSLKKIQRLNRITKEASEQSHRTIQPLIEGPYTIKELISSAQSFDHKFIAYEETTRGVQSNKLNFHFEKIKLGQSMAVVIGPEGGFTADEVNQLTENGYQSVRLGPRILRTETAPLYLLSALSYHFEES